MTTVTTVTIISKPGCHLCEVARGVVDAVVAELPGAAIEIQERSILEDVALFEQWWQKIPVVLIDDRLHAHWRLDAGRLRAALSAPREENR